MAVAQSAATTPSESRNLHLVNHPLVEANLSVLRGKTTAPEEFRRNLNQVSIILAVAAARTWPTAELTIETSLAACAGDRYFGTL
jgi:uracil phosphoribosyltransferase